MRLDIKITLNTGGTIGVHGENLTAEAVNEVFRIFARYPIESGTVRARGHYDQDQINDMEREDNELHEDREHGHIRDDRPNSPSDPSMHL